MTTLGPNLREARERLELTQEQVAERSGVYAGEISRIEAENAIRRYRLWNGSPRPLK